MMRPETSPRFHRLALVLALGLVPRTAAAQTPAADSAEIHAMIERGLQAMGGVDRLRALHNVTVTFTSVTFALGQEESPVATPRSTIGWGRWTTDWRAGRQRLEQESGLPTGTVQRSVRTVTPEGIMVETDGRQTPASAAAGDASRRALRLDPQRLLVTIAEHRSQLTLLPPRNWRFETHNGVRYAGDRDTVNIWFNRRTGLPAVVETLADDPILGDRSNATLYSRWQVDRGIMFAHQIEELVNDRLAAQRILGTVEPDAAGEADAFAIPDSIQAKMPAPAPPPPVRVDLVELAPGIWRAEGGTHHSLVAVQDGDVVIVELPQNAARSSAVIDTVVRRFPGKRITVVNTHHHWDHAGGIRFALSAGLRVVTHANNVEFVRGIGLAPKTIQRDVLTGKKKLPSIRGVQDTLTLGDGASRVVLLDLPTAHAVGMLAAYVPSAQLLFVADVVSPGRGPLPPVGSAEVVRMVEAMGLTVARVVGAHGGIADWSDLVRAARGGD